MQQEDQKKRDDDARRNNTTSTRGTDSAVLPKNTNNNSNNTNTIKNNNAQEGKEDEESEEDAYKSLMEMFDVQFKRANAAAEAIEEPEPVLSAENKDLLKQEENHFSKIGSDLGYFRAPAIRNDTLVFVSEGSIWLFARERRAGGEDFVQLLVRIGAKVIARWETNRVFSRICGWGLKCSNFPSMEGWRDKSLRRHCRIFGRNGPAIASFLILTTQFSDLGNPQLAKVDALTGKISVLPFEKAHGGTKDTKGCYLFYPLRQSPPDETILRRRTGENLEMVRCRRRRRERNSLGRSKGVNAGIVVDARRVVATNHRQDQRKNIFHQRQNRRGQLVGDERRRSHKTQLTFECEFDAMEYAIDATRIVMRVGADLKSATLTACAS